MAKLDCIWDTEAGKNDYPEVKKNLLQRFEVDSLYALPLSKFCEHGVYTKLSGYAKHTYRGSLKKDVSISELELAMICDSGYSFFGGHSRINSNGDFKVEIWID